MQPDDPLEPISRWLSRLKPLLLLSKPKWGPKSLTPNFFEAEQMCLKLLADDFIMKFKLFVYYFYFI